MRKNRRLKRNIIVKSIDIHIQSIGIPINNTNIVENITITTKKTTTSKRNQKPNKYSR